MNPRNAAAPGGQPGAGGDQVGTGSSPSLTATDDKVRELDLLDAGLHLIALGLPIVPVGKGKDPQGVIKWRTGNQDYVTQAMSADEWRTWAPKLNVHGIAVLGSNVYGTSILDIEEPGMGEPMIQAALNITPDTCQQTTVSGARHIYTVVEGEHPGGRVKLAQHPSPDGTDPVLLAERRGHAAYAVIVGPGRPPLRSDFAPLRLTREAYDGIEAMIRQAGTFVPTPPVVREYNRTGKGGGTGDIVTEALKQGALSPLAVLPDGWTITGHDPAGRTYVLRPGATSETSGNVKDGVVAIHSTAVDWAPTPAEDKSAKPISGAECLALSRFGGDFHAAMRWVETKAAYMVMDGEAPPEHWPAAVLADVHDLNTLGVTGTSVTDDHDDQGEAEGHRRIVLTKASTIEPLPTTWLWDNRLPTGALALIAGPEGTGKSTVGYTLAAQVTRGKLLGMHHGTPQAVIVAATEDSWARTIVPRLIAAGADLELVFRIEVRTVLGTGGYLTLPKDVPGLEAAVRETGAVLLLLDPLMSRLEAGLDSHKDAETRRALEPIAATAERTGLTVVGLIHFNKSGAADVLNNVMASKAFTAVARSVSTVIRDPNDDDGRRRIFGTPKNNLGRDDLPLLPFHLTEHRFSNRSGDTVVTSRVEWLGEQQGTMADLMRQARDTGDRSAAAEVAEWLADWLTTQGDRAPRKDIMDAARKERYSDDQVRRGREKLGLQTRRKGFPSVTWWMTAAEALLWDSGEEPSQGTVVATVRGERLTNTTAMTEAESSSRGSRGSQAVPPREPPRLERVRSGGTTQDDDDCPVCDVCGQPLMLIRPGRSTCEACRTNPPERNTA